MMTTHTHNGDKITGQGLQPGPFYDQCVLVAKSYMTLCDPMDCSPRSSSVYGIPQARMLEWTAIPFSLRSVVPSNCPIDW